MCQYRQLMGVCFLVMFYQNKLLIMELNLRGYKIQTTNLQFL